MMMKLYKIMGQYSLIATNLPIFFSMSAHCYIVFEVVTLPLLSSQSCIGIGTLLENTPD